MSKESTLLILGVLVLVSPYLGLPMGWLTILLILLGAGIITISQIQRRARTMKNVSPTESAEPIEAPAKPLSF